MKLSDYVEMAAIEYLQEVGQVELEARWIAEFYEDSGLLDDFPRQDLVAFSHLVQKSLTRRDEAARKQADQQMNKLIRVARQRK